MVRQKDVASEIVIRALVAPVATVPATINGPAVQRDGLLSGQIHLHTGVTGGGPSAQTADLKIQDSADGSTGWADFLDADGNVVAVAQITTIDSQEVAPVNLLGAKKFIRGVVDVTLTGGASPTFRVAATVALGGADVKPAAVPT